MVFVHPREAKGLWGKAKVENLQKDSRGGRERRTRKNVEGRSSDDASIGADS